jgi:hypothetical protein
MQYRPFGGTGFIVSALGFGAMRLPLRSADAADINESEAVRMIRTAVDAGVNYIHTAYPYLGGRSEVVVGLALRDGYRERVKLATKLPSWLVKAAGDFDRILKEQLVRLGVLPSPEEQLALDRRERARGFSDFDFAPDPFAPGRR